MKGQTIIEYLMTYGWAILIIEVVILASWRLGVFEINDNCCHTEYCDKIKDEVFKWAEENDFTIYCGSTCINACRDYLKGTNITDFDCHSICPDQYDGECNYEWMSE